MYWRESVCVFLLVYSLNAQNIWGWDQCLSQDVSTQSTSNLDGRDPIT